MPTAAVSTLGAMRSRLLPALLVAGAALALVAAPALSASASSASPSAPVDTNDFTITSFDAVYELGRTDDGQSTLGVTETIVAQFPDFDQNHGPLRAIPSSYDGHPTQVRVQSVTDESGADIDYDQSFEDGNVVLKIGDPDEYVRGEQTYVIAYTMTDVTRYFADKGDDEFYWDTNGLLWDQPFGSVTARVVLDDDLQAALTGDASCYFGGDGSTDECEIAETDDGYEATVSDLGPRQNMSVAIGFEPGTFAAAKFDFFAYAPLPLLIGLGASIAALIAAIALRVGRLGDAKGTGIVIAQYEPPQGIGLFLAANLVGKAKRGMAAAIVDLAVRRHIRIVEREGSDAFGVQRVDDRGLSGAEQRVESALLAGYQPEGDVRWLVKNDATLGTQVVAMTKEAANEAISRGLRRKPGAGPIVLVGLVGLLGFLFCMGGAVIGTTEVALGLGIFGAILTAFLGITIVIMLAGRRPLTTEGALVKEHLEGLREYIRLAEADRLQMLQSVSGAERVAGANGGPDVVKIYEKVLPYAVLFGLEKEWAGELAKYYDETPPDWYSGSNVGAFQVGVFASSIGSLSSNVSTSFSGSAASSSSGGSSGGGSSGGGGGGGGGGGW